VGGKVGGKNKLKFYFLTLLIDETAYKTVL